MKAGIYELVFFVGDYFNSLVQGSAIPFLDQSTGKIRPGGSRRGLSRPVIGFSVGI